MNKRLTQVSNTQTNGRRKILLGIGTGAALSVWHKPVINAVITPAHAQASVCPMITIGNVTSGPVSGTNVPAVCTATFDVLSGDAATPLTISAVTTGALPDNVSIQVQDLGTATSTSGPRVVWRGPAADAPFCSDLMPNNDVTITVTASCAASSSVGSFTQDFSLVSILMP